MPIFIPLEKVDIQKRMVYGTIGCEEVDHSGEILDYASAKAAFQKWSDDQFKASGGKSYGNVRAMHSRIAAGKVAEPLQFDDVAKKIHACAYISDDAEWQKVTDGVYTGFSPGGGYAKREADKAMPQFKRYTPTVIELSIVDVPCQPSATFKCIKADGTEEMRKFKNFEEPGDLDQGFRAKDGRFFKAKVNAKAWNKFLDEMDAARIEFEKGLPSEHPALAALKKAEEAAANLEGDDTEEEDEEDDEAAAAKKAARKIRLKKSSDHDMQKGFCSIARLANIIEDLTWLQETCEYERELEKDESEIPAELEAAIKQLVTIITAMVAEESAEMGKDMADKTVDMPRSTADQLIKAIGAGHLLAKHIKIIEPVVVTPPAPVDEELKKSLDAVTSDLAKERAITTELTKGFEGLTKRLEVMERQPVAPRGVLRVVDRQTERLPAPELRKDTSIKASAPVKPANLSPRDSRLWDATHNNNQ